MGEGERKGLMRPVEAGGTSGEKMRTGRKVTFTDMGRDFRC